MRYKLLILICSALIAFTVATNGGGDWTDFFVPFARGDLQAAYHPYHLQILLYPFHYLPYYLWSILTVLTVIVTSLKLKTNPIYVLLTLPGVALVWAGQIDSFIIIGVYLILSYSSPWLMGVSLVLFTVKPHVTWLVGLVVIWIYRRSLPKLLLLPILFAALSFLIYGLDWPLRWYMSIPTTINSNYGYQSILPTICFLPLPFLLKERRKQLLAAFCVSALLIPVGIYSFTNFLVILCPVWLIPITWLVYILHSLGNLGFIIPIAALLGQFFPDIVKFVKRQWNDFT